jgi:isoleucyl-tRNA synthetase
MKSDKKSHYVVGADFVSTEDGTGMVHIAPAFGEDDMNVGKKHDLPVLMTVEETGKFKKEIHPWAGVFVKAADKSIIEELDSRNLMFFSDNNGIKHEYPFCWRCSTPLLYYAKESWFIKMSSLRKDLIENNKKINWVPSHLKEGRFGEWIKEVKDWALSRERYWATPLPIWECEKCHDHQIVGAIDDLEKLSAGNKNNFFLMRHGHSENNQKKIVSCYPEAQNYGLTPDGEKKTRASAEKLKKYLVQKKLGPIDVIFSSDLERTRHTAKIVKEVTGFAGEIIFDERLREVHLGAFNNKPHKEFQAQFANIYERFENKVDGAENWQDVKKRMMEFLREINGKYSGKNILIVSHGDPVWILSGALEHLGRKEQLEHLYPQNADWRKVELKNFPYNEDGALDLHRPYIDEIKIKCKKCGGTSKRVKDVIDVWFDSGAMPYAQVHWPFDKKQKLNYPAEFIAEGIDQTRGWFYTLLAIGTLLGKKSPYKNVVSYGHVLDKDGQKMSKSKGNVVNPWDAIQKFGSDGVRWYFYVVNSAGEPKRFDDREVMDHIRKFILLYYNTFKFLGMHISGKINLSSAPEAEDPLDKWVISRLNSLKFAVAKSMDAYDATTSARKMEDFIEDLSVWYLRRSRKRLSQPKDKKDKEAAQKTLAYVLLETSKISAPFVPFFAEEIYQSLKKIVSGYRFEESVHMELFPKAGKSSEKIEHQMKLVRDLVTMGHRLRAEAQIKVRQPLNTFYIISKTDLGPEMFSILADELNVKKIEKKDPQGLNIKRSSEGGVSVALDIEITPALREEGMIRDLMRNIQEARKELSLSPKDKAISSITSEDSPAGHAIMDIIVRNAVKIKKDAILSELKTGVKDEKLKLEKEFQIEGVKILITLR